MKSFSLQFTDERPLTLSLAIWGQQGMASTMANCQANAWSKASRPCSDPATYCHKGWFQVFWSFQKLLEIWGSIWKLLIFFFLSDQFFKFGFKKKKKRKKERKHSISQTKCGCRLDPAPALLVYDCSCCSWAIDPRALQSLASPEASGTLTSLDLNTMLLLGKQTKFAIAFLAAVSCSTLCPHGTCGQVSNFVFIFSHVQPVSPAILCNHILILTAWLCFPLCQSLLCLGELCLFLVCTGLTNALSMKSPAGPNTRMNSDPSQGH